MNQIARNLELDPPNIIRNESDEDPYPSKSKQTPQQPPPQRMNYNPHAIGGKLSAIPEEEKQERHRGGHG